MTEEGDIDALAEEISAFAQAQDFYRSGAWQGTCLFQTIDRPRFQAMVEAGIIDGALAL